VRAYGRLLATAALAAIGAGPLAPGCASVELAAPRIREHRGPGFAHPPRRIVALPARCSFLSLRREPTWPAPAGESTLEVPASPDDSAVSPPSPDDTAASPPSPDDGPAAEPTEPPPAARPASRTVSTAEREPGASWVPCHRETVAAVDGAVRSTIAFRGLDLIDSERLNATTLSHVVTVEERDLGGPTVERVRTGATFAEATPAQQRAILDQLGADGVLATRIRIGSGVGASERRLVEVQVRLLSAAGGELVSARRCSEEVAGLVGEARALERLARCAATLGEAP
jgi:hypothetical protein